MIIAIDFDGTCVTNDFPKIGKDIGAIPVLKALVLKKHKLVLNTIRSGFELYDAENWFVNNDIKLFASNENHPKLNFLPKVTRKIFAELYIDDLALNIPLKTDLNLSDNPFVDWDAVEELLVEKDIL
jgi:hypothetical protein